MKRLTVLFFSVFFLFALPTTLFAGHDTAGEIVREANRTAQAIVRDANRTASEVVRDSTGHLQFRGSRPPRHYRHNKSEIEISVYAEAGFYYEPYHGPQYYPRYERRVVVADSSCGGLVGFFLGDLFDGCGRKATAVANERVALEQIRAGVVTGTMGKEGTVLYDSPNGPTSLRASRDPMFGTAADSRVATTVSPRLSLPSVDLSALRAVRGHVEQARADDAEFAALGRAIEEISDPKRAAYTTDVLQRDVVILRHLLRKLERSGVPAAVVAALADAIEYLDRASS